MTTERNRQPRVRAEAGRGTGTPRTLAEELRTRPDDDLAALLRARPDLLSPVPNDLTQLATRAGTRASVVRALERLDRFTLQVAQTLAVAPDPTSYATLLALMTGDPVSHPADTEAPGNAENAADAGEGAGEPDDGGSAALTDAIAGALPRAVAALRSQALVWGTNDRLHLVRTARELLTPGPSGPSPTGLGPTVAEATAGMSPGRLQDILATAGLPATHDPVTAVDALASLFGDRARMGSLLAEAPAESLSLLGRLTWGPPYGTVPADPTPPIRWLTGRGLLLPAGPRTVVLPREAALHLRAGRAHRVPEPVAPPLAPAAEYRSETVDATAAGQAYTALATLEEVVKEWDLGGPAVLRAGGLGVRDLKRTAAAVGLSEETTAFWLELAYVSGLLASDGEADERFAPTPAYDTWLRGPAEQRWTVLVAAWLTMTRAPGLVGGQDAKGRPLTVLGPGLDRSPAPEIRRRVLALLASLPPGAAASSDAVVARLRWEHGLASAPDGSPPGDAGSAARRPAARGAARPQSGRSPRAADVDPPATEDTRIRFAPWTLAEAEMLGVTGRGALSSHGRALLTEGPGEPEAAAGPRTSPRGARAAADSAAQRAAKLLVPHLPQPVDHVLLQADLTAVAPGPLERPLAEMLGVLADVESTGGATVYRFTPGSVRRALDAGRTASDLHAFLAEHARTPVPQPLSYLIDDVARRHGHLRVGAASAYVRCDDDALLAEIVADRRSAGLRLRRLAPTVLAAEASPEALLARLREMGYAPAAESPDGDVLVARADARRTPPRTPPAPVVDGPPVPAAPLLQAAVKAVRAGDRAATAVRRPVAARGSGAGAADRGGLPRTTSAETLATVQAAALSGGAVWIGYVNAEGAASQRVIAPVRVEGGFVTGYDHTADEVRTYPLHRITGVAELEDGAAP